MSFPDLIVPRLVLAAVALLAFAPTDAAAGNDAKVFAQGFEERPIAPLFPFTAGEFQLPEGPIGTQLAWLLGELAAGASTSSAEVNAHFDAGWLSQIPVGDTLAFIQSVRNGYPDAVLQEPVTVTPLRLVAVIRSPVNGQLGFMQFGTRHGPDGRIVQFGVSGYSGSVQYPADQESTLAQAVARFGLLSPDPSLLVAQLDSGGQCVPIADVNADTPRATASIFKTWILAALAREVAEGTFPVSFQIPLVAAHVAPGGVLQQEPLGTQFTIAELAAMMMGVSDNTATDLLLEAVGRPQVDAAIEGTGVADPSLLTPLLGINEQFHLFYSLPLATSLSYVNGDDAFQDGFIASQLAPLGPLGAGPHPYFHVQLLTDGSWRASPDDICATLATLHAEDDAALEVIDAALGAGAAIPGVRSAWDRVWFKGGSLAASSNNFHVFTYAWLLQREGERPYVVVMMANSDTGGIDQFQMQSVAARIIELLGAL